MANKKPYEIKLKKINKSNTFGSSYRTYYKSEKGNIYMSQEENPKHTNPNHLMKGNTVFYNANNREGEPEYALDKNKYKVTIK